MEGERCPTLVNQKRGLYSCKAPCLILLVFVKLSPSGTLHPSISFLPCLCPSSLRPAAVAEIAVRGCLPRWKMARRWRSGDDRTHRDTHTHTRSPSRTHVRPALSFAVEMVPAWANLHNTLLTPLLYSSITPRQLLQVWAFVWACLWLCKARHKRLISQLLSPSSSSPLPSSLFFLPFISSPLILVLLLVSRSSLFHFKDTKPAEWQQPDNENNNASIFFSSPLTQAGRIPRFSRQCIIPPSLSHPPSRRLSILLILFLICTYAICLQFFFPFIFVISPYCTWVDQAQIPCQSSFLHYSTCPTQGAS